MKNYNETPIIIKDYSAYFGLIILMFLSMVLIVLWIDDYQIGRFEQMNMYSFEFFRVVVSLLFVVWYLYFQFYTLPKKFALNPSFFKFSNTNIHYTNYLYGKDNEKQELDIPLEYIKEVSFCVMTELPDRFARWHHLSAWQLYRKSSIGVHIGKSVLYIRYLLTYILFVLPYRLWRLYKSNEPYSLLGKNLFIFFSNRNYILVNIYSTKELEELMEYFENHNIVFTKQTYFIPHLQNQGWFIDKEEVWSKKFN